MIVEIKYCNKCGMTIEDNAKIHSMGLNFGFGSNYDNQRWDFELCESCLVDTVKGFKLSPNGFNESHYDPETTTEERQGIFENWKQTGKWEEMMYVSYEKLIAYKDYYEDEYINECIKKYHPNKPSLE